jgi:hypothetical protein
MSLVATAVDRLSENHSLDPDVDRAKTSTGRSCQLASGVEANFVAMLCNYFVDHLSATRHHFPQFHEFFYIPNTRAEGKVGYDLSIGQFSSDFRIRTMHKLKFRRWCDQKWQWSVSASFDEHNRPYRTYGHLRTLLEEYDHHPNLEPYLVLNVCYCLHDYRRMEVNYEDYCQIPALDSLLRTAIISLRAIPRDALLDSGFKLTVTKNAPLQREHELPREYLARIADKELFDIMVKPGNIPLYDCILTLDDFCARIEQGFVDGMWQVE